MARDLFRRAVGQNVRAMREEQGLSQERFGFRYGYQRSWVGRVENGRLNLTMDSIQQLADRLQIEVFDLVARPAEAPPPGPMERPGDEAGEEQAGEEQAGEEGTGEEAG